MSLAATPPGPSTTPSPALDVLTIALFVLALLAPAIDQCIRPDSVRDARLEFRAPAPAPEAPRTLGDVAAFPRRFESHYTDTFGLRDALLRWNSIEHWILLGSSPTRAVEHADGWAFLGSQSRSVYRGLMRLDEADLDDWVKRLRERRDFFASQGAKYLFVLCPSKETIYPERVPASWTKVGPTRMDQFAERAEREGDLPFFDLRPALLAAKAEDADEDWVYTRLGTHWNGRGGYAAYAAIVERLRQDFPTLAVLPLDECRAVEPESTDSLGHQLYIDDLVPQRLYSFERAAGKGYETVHESKFHDHQKLLTRKDVDAPRLLWMHDSFGPGIDQLICETFSFVESHWDWELPMSVVFAARPEVVLETYVERVLVEKSPLPFLPAGDEAPPETRFARSTDVAWVDRRDGEGRAEPFASAEVERRADALRLTIREERDGLLLPPLDLAPDSVALLRLDLECREATRVDVLVRPEGARAFSRRHHVMCEFGPDASAAVVCLPDVGERFEVLLRPVQPAKELVFRALEIRRCPLGARSGE